MHQTGCSVHVNLQLYQQLPVIVKPICTTTTSVRARTGTEHALTVDTFLELCQRSGWLSDHVEGISEQVVTRQFDAVAINLGIKRARKQTLPLNLHRAGALWTTRDTRQFDTAACPYSKGQRVRSLDPVLSSTTTEFEPSTLFPRNRAGTQPSCWPLLRPPWLVNCTTSLAAVRQPREADCHKPERLDCAIGLLSPKTECR